MDHDHMHRVKSVIEKIQVFQGFNIVEVQRFIKLCRPKAYKKNEIVYECGSPSKDMFIVLQGKLVAMDEDGTRLNDIFPGSTTGEMGALTGNDRSATVVTEEDARGLVIEASHLKTLMRVDSDIRIKVLENMVSQLCDRVMGASKKFGNYAQKSRYQTEATVA
jgi:CRP-like cAMP-binding protein